MNVFRLYKFGWQYIIFLCFFFYLYTIQFKYVPVSTRILLAGAGFIILIFSIAKQASQLKDIFISKGLLRYFVVFSAIIIISVFSIIINGSGDIEFIKYPLSLVFILLAGYLLHFIIIKIYGTINYKIILNYIIAAVLIQVIISVIAFLIPSLNNALQSIQNFNALDTSKLEQTTGFRLNGFGSTFFGAGLINGFALLSIAALVKQKNNSRRRIIYLSFAFVTIFALGAMMARTSMIGGIVGLMFLLIPTRKFNVRIVKMKARFLGYIILLPLLLIATVFTLFPSLVQSLQTAASFGFEMFVNYSETGKFSTASTDALENMYVFPDNAKTYIIGDGHYYVIPGDPTNGYYKSIDVGYLRLIYYFGIIGSLIYFLLQYVAVKNALKSNPGDKTFRIYILLVFLLCLINSFKGFTDLFYLTSLFYFGFNGSGINSDNFLIKHADE